MGAAWSGGTPDYKALQAVRAAITANAANASDPWSFRAPCAPGAPMMPGVECDWMGNRVVRLRAFDVFACSKCLWSNHAWWPAPQFAQLTALRMLDLSNMGMQGESNCFKLPVEGSLPAAPALTSACMQEPSTVLAGALLKRAPFRHAATPVGQPDTAC